jgi:hypothetical protein
VLDVEVFGVEDLFNLWDRIPPKQVRQAHVFALRSGEGTHAVVSLLNSVLDGTSPILCSYERSRDTEEIVAVRAEPRNRRTATTPERAIRFRMGVWYGDRWYCSEWLRQC